MMFSNQAVQVILKPTSLQVSPDLLTLKVFIGPTPGVSIDKQNFVKEFIVPVSYDVLQKLLLCQQQQAQQQGRKSPSQQSRSKNCIFINEISTADIPGYNATLTMMRSNTPAQARQQQPQQSVMPAIVIKGPIQKIGIFSNGYFSIRTKMLCPGLDGYTVSNLRHLINDKPSTAAHCF